MIISRWLDFQIVSWINASDKTIRMKENCVLDPKNTKDHKKSTLLNNVLILVIYLQVVNVIIVQCFWHLYWLTILNGLLFLNLYTVTYHILVYNCFITIDSTMLHVDSLEMDQNVKIFALLSAQTLWSCRIPILLLFLWNSLSFVSELYLNDN